jgi:hypothetical protein
MSFWFVILGLVFFLIFVVVVNAIASVFADFIYWIIANVKQIFKLDK